MQNLQLSTNAETMLIVIHMASPCAMITRSGLRNAVPCTAISAISCANLDI